jgi:hypothetical protein
MKNNTKQAGAAMQVVDKDYEKIDQQYLYLLKKLEFIIRKIKESRSSS